MSKKMNIKKSIAFAICGGCFIFNEAIGNGIVWVNKGPVSESIIKRHTGLEQCEEQVAPIEFISWLGKIFSTSPLTIIDFRNFYDANGNYVPTFGQKFDNV